MENQNKKKNKVKLLTAEKQNALVVVGADITVTVEEARGFYRVTDLKERCANEKGIVHHEDNSVTVSQDAFNDFMTSRNVLREIAKQVLFTSGDVVEPNDFIASL